MQSAESKQSEIVNRIKYALPQMPDPFTSRDVLTALKIEDSQIYLVGLALRVLEKQSEVVCLGRGQVSPPSLWWKLPSSTATQPTAAVPPKEYRSGGITVVRTDESVKFYIGDSKRASATIVQTENGQKYWLDYISTTERGYVEIILQVIELMLQEDNKSFL